jgi:hypothetical protein
MKKVVSDSSGEPRKFDTRGKAHRFMKKHLLFGARITDEIAGISGRYRINPKR